MRAVSVTALHLPPFDPVMFAPHTSTRGHARDASPLLSLYSVGLLAALSRPHSTSAMTLDVATPPSVRRVLVVGASGSTGRALVAQALERGYAVTAFVRNPSAFRVGHANLSVVNARP